MKEPKAKLKTQFQNFQTAQIAILKARLKLNKILLAHYNKVFNQLRKEYSHSKRK